MLAVVPAPLSPHSVVSRVGCPSGRLCRQRCVAAHDPFLLPAQGSLLHPVWVHRGHILQVLLLCRVKANSQR